MNAIQLAPPHDSWDEVLEDDLELADDLLEDDDEDEGSGPVAIALDEAWLDETWDSVDAGEPALRFDIDGDRLAVHRTPRTRGTMTEATGVVKRIHEDRLLLGTPGLSSEVAVVSYRLPASLDLRALIRAPGAASRSSRSPVRGDVAGRRSPCVPPTSACGWSRAAARRGTPPTRWRVRWCA